MKLGTWRDSFDLFHSSWRNLIATALIALAAYECAELVLEDDPLRVYSTGLIAIGTVGILAIFKNWRLGLYSFVAWIAVEDLIRKYLGNNMIVYFAKDFLALALYLSFFISRKSASTKLYRPPFLITLSVFFWYCLVQAFNVSVNRRPS
ncbi:MAG: hypothetical protein DMG36_17165 [Acidobacteria bacterium]|nr:MAG: hypothetical protein DMG36_17165 [Acidobacteriota bacterium]